MINVLHFAEQPMLRLSLQNSRCSFTLSINEVPIFRNLKGAAGFLEMPINEWVFQGANEVSVVLRNCEEEGPLHPQSRFHLTLHHKKKGAALKSRQELGKLSFRYAEDGQYLTEPAKEGIPEPEPPPTIEETTPAEAPIWTAHDLNPGSHTHEVTLRANLSVPNSWPAMPWRDTLPLPAQTAATYALRTLTANLQNMLQRRDYASVEKILELKTKHTEHAYHLRNPQLLDLTGLRERLTSPKAVLTPLPEELDVQFGSNGRIAQLLCAQTQRPALRLTEAGQPDCHLSIWWALRQVGWVAVA